jgi:hypothetical protein
MLDRPRFIQVCPQRVAFIELITAQNEPNYIIIIGSEPLFFL